jgi:hypothetical protein
MTAVEMLKKAGYPNTEAGRNAFYKKYPTKESFMKKFASGGSTPEAFPQQPDSNQFFNIGVSPNFPGPYYAHGGSHMPYVHYQMAGPTDEAMAQDMPEQFPDMQGGNVPFAARQAGTAPMDVLPRFENGGMDPKSMAEQLLNIRQQYSSMTKKQLKKELEDIQDNMGNPYQAEGNTLALRQAVITELLGSDMPTAQKGGIAFPQQPDNDEFFSAFPFNNKYRKGGAPCYECGGSYDVGGSPYGYGYFPMSMMAMGGTNVGLDRADQSDNLIFQTGGQSPQGFSMDDYQNSMKNQFKDFLSGTAEAYNAGQIMQQGEMGELPQNAFGGYNAMNPNMNYYSGQGTGAEMTSTVDPSKYNTYTSFKTESDNLNNKKKPGFLKKVMGEIYSNQMNKYMNKQYNDQMMNQMNQMNQNNTANPSTTFDPVKDSQANAIANKKADDNVTFKRGGGYYNFLPKHGGPPGNTSGATNTGNNAGGFTPEMAAWISEQMKNKQAQTPGLSVKDLDEWWNKKLGEGSNTGGGQPRDNYGGYYPSPGGFYNPWSGGYESMRFRGTPGGDYRIRIKGKGPLPFAGMYNPEGKGSMPGGMNPEMMANMNPEQLQKYVDMMKGSGFKGKLTEKGLFKRWLGPRKSTFEWSFGNPEEKETPMVDQNLLKKMEEKKPSLMDRIKNIKTKRQRLKDEVSFKPSDIGPDTGDDFVVPEPPTFYPGSSVPKNDENFQLPTPAFMNQGNTLAYGGNIYAQGGSNDDIVWLDEDEIRAFEMGGGVLEYLDGGEFKQYY